MLQAGTETGSLMNHLMSRVGSPIPTVGAGATILGWTDRTACTIIEVSRTGKIVVVQQDLATRIDKNGISDSQEYAYTANPDGATRTFKMCKFGWREAGTGGKGNGLLIGSRRQYHDYSF